METIVLRWLICFSPVSIALLTMSRAHRVQRRRESRLPVTEKLLRPPGESLRRQIDQLDEKLYELTLVIVGFPMVLAASVMASINPLPVSVLAGLALLALIVCLVSARSYIRAAVRRRKFRLGLSGKLAVAEELNKLMRDGCHVYHDLPKDTLGHIDHVIVTPGGVYVVETKAMRKPTGSAGKEDYKIAYDGEALFFQDYRSVKYLTQAKRNAAWLSQYLTQATGEPSPVKAILTFPGWDVVSQANGNEVQVLNPGMIREALLDRVEVPLAAAQIQRITRRLDERCRDVVF